MKKLFCESDNYPILVSLWGNTRSFLVNLRSTVGGGTCSSYQLSLKEGQDYCHSLTRHGSQTNRLIVKKQTTLFGRTTEPSNNISY